MPVAGRGDSFEPIAARCRAEQKATDGMIRWMIRYGDILALTHTGKLDLADQRVADYSRFSSQGQFVGWAIARIMAGLVATYRGKFSQAIASFEQALAALNAETSLPWRLPAGCCWPGPMPDWAEPPKPSGCWPTPANTPVPTWLARADGHDR